MESFTIDITIPKDLVSDYLGSMILDIMHDAKGRETIKGVKLHVLTDLLAESFTTDRRQFVFMKSYNYLKMLWASNMKAFGGGNDYDWNSKDYNYLREHVFLPISDSDNFVYLGTGKKSPESENYFYQKSKCKKIIKFQSPNSIENFYERSKAFVDQITTTPRLVSLDMKSAAGLIRSTTDPIGYVSSIATYSDPGYNMAGMSAIRNMSTVDFKEKNNNTFSYRINLETENETLPFFTTEYFWGETDKKDMREYILIKILDGYFYRSLPKAREMSETLNHYITETPIMTIVDSYEKLGEIYRTLLINAKKTREEYAAIYSGLHKGQNIVQHLEKISRNFDIKKLTQWCRINRNNPLFIAYIVSSLKLYEAFNLNTKYIFPEDVIEHMNPEKNLAYCMHHLELIYQFINQPREVFQNDRYQVILENALDSKKIGRTKIVNIMKNLIKNKYTEYEHVLKKRQKNINNILINLIENFDTDINIDYQLRAVLVENIDFFVPGVEPTDNNIKLSLLDLADRFGMAPDYEVQVAESPNFNALKHVLGKYSGDFGQTLWCMATGNIFATEDNNSSAIACIMHQIPKEYIKGDYEDWVSIHGYGDGSCVEAIVNG
jgi:hypothetical protein